MQSENLSHTHLFGVSAKSQLQLSYAMNSSRKQEREEEARTIKQYK